ncbi:thiamine pyrophosphate-dependent dehydrogenase E1 component subunit alpha [Noviherbaspirillum galbum]|uniref:Thiamine pyrophosphate-dependent dehydrogenase E1 component subunit alpha n=1 Tax=Noviherbaspirillum galbum TaxID=2709383 RepID=A0A6B3SV94_9BURK|nr:thiamine pyrophosphate-dependent dehydrogenase E1 component subunit alpha [Noviherbaspirillum galbum]NEX62292.1 thiamine pyrophosphate-dependent dehydrogenase E1 component subunit alpha [Noviherbaspirillum galbum]
MTQTARHDSAASMLECMMLIRAYEEKLAAMHAAGNAAGTCTSVGQEAAAVGVVRALRPEDRILTNHRSAGHLIARGADPGRMMAEVLGRSTGYCKGKSGSLHISAKELGVVLTSTIVGGELSLATGVALSKSMLGERGVVVCFFGDGAACEGIFHESLNLAAVWKLPILFVCENNQWQAFVHRNETMLGDHISPRAATYGMPAKTVDGNDPQAVHAAAIEAIAAIESTGMPYFLEAFTYRLRGHYEPDDQDYVDAAELESWRQRDPIELAQRRLTADGTLSVADITAMEERVAAAIEKAAAFATASPFPDASELLTDVYA